MTVKLALALMLLIGSGLLIRSFLKIQAVDLGCDPRGLLTFTASNGHRETLRRRPLQRIGQPEPEERRRRRVNRR